MRIFLLITIIFAFGCNSVSVPLNPKSVNTREFRSMLTSYDANFKQIEISNTSDYSEACKVAMDDVLHNIENLNSLLSKESGTSSLHRRTFWFNEYSVLLIEINNGYRNAVEIIKQEYRQLPQDAQVKFLENHNRTLGFNKLFLAVSAAATPRDVTGDMERLLDMVMSMAYVARQVTT